MFDEHARQGNIATCANLFGTLGRGLAMNSNYTAQSQWDAKAGNSHSVQSLVALAPNQASQATPPPISRPPVSCLPRRLDRPAKAIWCG
ncbi:hypothetical protein [Bradyrhizobium sp. BR 1433]|uniref:hypothetical protein n=1 Tax=Bradyrhizobium sp. BR 1433 TaxID=3447967 RepID=UPI003EE6C217